MAELLIKAREPWNNDADTAKMTDEERKSFDSRSRKGDIIVVRPDGWAWGKLECLPDFVVVKTKETYEEAKKYEDSLTEEKQETVDGKTITRMDMVKFRKYAIPSLSVDSIAIQVKDFETITAVDLKAEINEKVLSGDTIKKDS